jgi:hypothetical protein
MIIHPSLWSFSFLPLDLVRVTTDQLLLQLVVRASTDQLLLMRITIDQQLLVRARMNQFCWVAIRITAGYSVGT